PPASPRRALPWACAAHHPANIQRHCEAQCGGEAHGVLGRAERLPCLEPGPPRLCHGQWPHYARRQRPRALGAARGESGLSGRRQALRACPATPTLPSPVASRACPTCATYCRTQAGPGSVGGGIKGGGLRKGHAQTKKQERDDGSKKSHPALNKGVFRFPTSFLTSSRLGSFSC